MAETNKIAITTQELERPSQIANTNLLRINRIEAIASSLAGIEISARSGSQFVSIKEIVGIPKVILLCCLEWRFTLLNPVPTEILLCTIVSLALIKNPQGIPRILVIRSFQVSTLFSRFMDIESIERTSNTCSTFGRPCVISPDLDFSYINDFSIMTVNSCSRSRQIRVSRSYYYRINLNA
ncbi:hypothetical protein Lal_00044950 [Lupinus albus]|nr:hypothetical protein Lal_00044950 [Lupinus albus]